MPSRPGKLIVAPCPETPRAFLWRIVDDEGRTLRRAPYVCTTRQGAWLSGAFWLQELDAETRHS